MVPLDPLEASLRFPMIGWSALHMCNIANLPSKGCLEPLIQSGADIHAVEQWGRTPTIIALLCPRHFCVWRVSLMEKQGFDLEAFLAREVEVLSPSLGWTRHSLFKLWCESIERIPYSFHLHKCESVFSRGINEYFDCTSWHDRLSSLNPRWDQTSTGLLCSSCECHGRWGLRVLRSRNWYGSTMRAFTFFKKANVKSRTLEWVTAFGSGATRLDETLDGKMFCDWEITDLPDIGEGKRMEKEEIKNNYMNVHQLNHCESLATLKKQELKVKTFIIRLRIQRSSHRCTKPWKRYGRAGRLIMLLVRWRQWWCLMVLKIL